jgi:hypothetical protein
MQDFVLGVMAHNSYSWHYGGECNDISHISPSLLGCALNDCLPFIIPLFFAVSHRLNIDGQNRITNQ